MARAIRRSDESFEELKARIQARLDALELTAITATNRTPLERNFIRDILSGRKRSLGAKAAIVAKILQCDVAYLLLEQDYPVSDGTKRAAKPDLTWGRIPIVGIVEAKTFREKADLSLENIDQYPTIQAPANNLYPGAKCYALHVRGDSMNGAKPLPLLDGMIALYVDMKSADLRPETGKLYVVKYSRDGGTTWETTIRRAKVFARHVDLAAESLVALYPALTYPDPAGHIVEIVGLVYQAIATFS